MSDTAPDDVPVDEVDDESDDPMNLAVYPDEPPKSGEWVDSDDVISAPTEEELEEGRLLGETIDVDDDDSTGVDY